MDDYLTEVEMTMAFSSGMEEVFIEEKRQAILEFNDNGRTASFNLDVPQIVIGRTGKSISA